MAFDFWPDGGAFDPFAEMRRLQDEMNHVFSSFQHAPPAGFSPVNVYANEDGVAISARLPGVRPEDLNLSVFRDTTLTLRGRRDPEAADQRTYQRRERGHAEFVRNISLPFRVDPDRVEATVHGACCGSRSIGPRRTGRSGSGSAAERFKEAAMATQVARSREDQPAPISGRQQRAAAAEGAEPMRRRLVYAPPTDIYGTDDGLVVLADMPGISSETAEVMLEKERLTIRGRSQEQPPSGFSLVYREYGPGDYERVFTLSDDIEVGRIEANLKNGVLRVFLPKAGLAQRKRIQVHAS